MKSLYVEAHSVWQKINSPAFSTLNSHLNCDVCVIGAGIAGLTTAYMLAKAGRSVVVIDREARLGLHETGLTSAHLSNAFDDRYYVLQRLHGAEGARIGAESHTEAINIIENICNEEQIECDFRRVSGYLFLSPEDDMDLFKREMTATRAAGLDVNLLSRAPVQMFDTGPCIHFPEQAQFHPVKYLTGLAHALLRHGGMIFTETPAVKIDYGPPHTVMTDQNYEITCDHLVVCTDSPINDIVTMHTKMAAYRTYVIAVEIPRGQMEPMLLWDTGDPYHYIRLMQENSWRSDLLIVGGEDHRTGQDNNPELRYEKLKSWVRDRLLLEPKVVSQWSGQIIEPYDTVAFIGKNPTSEKNVYIATGDSGQGLTHGTIAGVINRDLILGKPNRWASLYDPGRINLRGFNEYIRENYHSLTPYTDWLDGGDVDSQDKIKPGEGGIIRQGLKKLACYKDTFGNSHVFSATCPHLGGCVRWNSLEKTWDCPCHGSRFHRYGEVLNGPAPHGLKPLRETGEESHLPPSP